MQKMWFSVGRRLHATLSSQKTRGIHQMLFQCWPTIETTSDEYLVLAIVLLARDTNFSSNSLNDDLAVLKCRGHRDKF